jgi:DNA-directed RNA polymerase specialized sigma24 family protein
MSEASEAPDTPEAPDWDAIRLSLRRTVGGLAGGADTTVVDDLVQEACVRYLRVSRRETIREPEALLATLARRTWYDHLRRTVRTRERFASLGDDELGVADPAQDWQAALGDPAERLALAVQEIFAGRGATECLDLLRHFLAAASWQDLATRQGVAYAALRKRWSRCLAVARAELAADADLSQWLD